MWDQRKGPLEYLAQDLAAIRKRLLIKPQKPQKLLPTPSLLKPKHNRLNSNLPEELRCLRNDVLIATTATLGNMELWKRLCMLLKNGRGREVVQLQKLQICTLTKLWGESKRINERHPLWRHKQILTKVLHQVMNAKWKVPMNMSLIIRT